MKILFISILYFVTSTTHALTYSAFVHDVIDGDTFAINNDDSLRIRMLGINTNETVDNGCHALPAKNRLVDLIEGETVTLTVSDPGIELRGRPARFVDLGGIDIGKTMLDEGLALPYPNEDDRSRNEIYLDYAADAQQAEIGIWDSTACGNGPSQNIPIELVVSWDADGDDSQNINGEWVDINNKGSSTLSLTSWRLRDPSTRFYEFPSGTSISAGGMLRVFVGTGTNTSSTQYWGNSGPIYTNDVGQGTYLLDPDNDIRAIFNYPCRISCSDTLIGKINLTVNYDAVGDDTQNPNGEWVDIENLTGSAINLYGYFLDSFYHFEKNHVIPANGTMRVRVGQGTDSATDLHAGRSGALFTNSGGSMSLRRADAVLIDTYSWPVVVTPPSTTPTRACVPVPVGDDVNSVICFETTSF